MESKLLKSKGCWIFLAVSFFIFLALLATCSSDDISQYDANKKTCQCEVEYVKGFKSTSPDTYNYTNKENLYSIYQYYYVANFDPSNIYCWEYLQQFSLLHRDNSGTDYLRIDFYDTIVGISSRNKDSMAFLYTNNHIATYRKNINLVFFDPPFLTDIKGGNKNNYVDYFTYEQLSFHAKKYNSDKRKIVD